MTSLPNKLSILESATYSASPDHHKFLPSFSLILSYPITFPSEFPKRIVTIHTPEVLSSTFYRNSFIMLTNVTMLFRGIILTFNMSICFTLKYSKIHYGTSSERLLIKITHTNEKCGTGKN